MEIIEKNISEKKIKSRISWRNFPKAFFAAWEKTRTVIFFLLIVVSISYGLMLWKENLYGERGKWSYEQKMQYINENYKKILFKENELNKVVNEIEKRKKEFESKIEESRDIFASYEKRQQQ